MKLLLYLQPGEPTAPKTFNIEVRHTLDYSGYNHNCGGNTLVVVSFDNVPLLLRAKCRPDEPYNRKFGTLACIQRLLDIKYPGYIINDWTAVDNATNTLAVEASKSLGLNKLWFLPGNKKPWRPQDSSNERANV